MTNIKIEQVEPAKHKDGSNVEGVSKNGRHWKLWKINDKYSYFSEENCDLGVGETYSCEVETKQDGKFTNYTIRAAVQTDGNTHQTGKGEIQTGEQIIFDELVKINERLDGLAKYLKKEMGDEGQD